MLYRSRLTSWRTGCRSTMTRPPTPSQRWPHSKTYIVFTNFKDSSSFSVLMRASWEPIMLLLSPLVHCKGWTVTFLSLSQHETSFVLPLVLNPSCVSIKINSSVYCLFRYWAQFSQYISWWSADELPCWLCIGFCEITGPHHLSGGRLDIDHCCMYIIIILI